MPGISVQLTPTISVPSDTIHGAQETPRGLVILAGGNTTLVDPSLASGVRDALGFMPVRPFLPDDPRSPMAKYNNPNIDDPPPPMPRTAAPPLHIPGQPMTDDVKKRLGIT